ncbi:MAG: PD40 domain-containing protein, partial [Mycolicibacterium aromaticivorans]|nr:PD40 domain-containing protein [Mycolicibacterium aromaticivorans]
AALWLLPAAGGESVQLAELPAGITAVRTARRAAAVVISAPLLPSAGTVDDERRLRKLRKDNKISAILHTGYPVRHWDSDLGPDETHLFRVAADGELTDVTREPGPALGEADFAVSPDGTFAVATWRVSAPRAALRSMLVRIDLRTGERSVIAEDPAADLEHPAISPDGTAVVFTRETVSNPRQAPRITLCHLDLRSGDWTQLAAGWDRWPASATWAHDGSAVLVTADDNGRCPIFAISLDGDVRQITDDDFSYSNVAAAPDGIVYALRSSYAAPPHPVRVDRDGAIGVLPCVELPELPGELTETVATTADGTRVRSWLVLPSAGGQEPVTRAKDVQPAAGAEEDDIGRFFGEQVRNGRLEGNVQRAAVIENEVDVVGRIAAIVVAVDAPQGDRA